MQPNPFGRVEAIALRSGRNQCMIEVTAADAVADHGLTGDYQPAVDRGITLISAPQWGDVQRELKADLPWHTRRANVLVSAKRLASLIGRTIRIGDATVEIKAETKPCALMDELHQGLRNALTPDCRGGVYGRVVKGGPIRVGDAIRVDGT